MTAYGKKKKKKIESRKYQKNGAKTENGVAKCRSCRPSKKKLNGSHHPQRVRAQKNGEEELLDWGREWPAAGPLCKTEKAKRAARLTPETPLPRTHTLQRPETKQGHPGHELCGSPNRDHNARPDPTRKAILRYNYSVDFKGHQ